MQPLEKFVSEEIKQLATTFGKLPLTYAIVDLMRNMVIQDESEVLRQFLSLIYATRDAAPEDVHFVGGNAATLLVNCFPSALQGQDLSRTKLDGFHIYNRRFHNMKTVDLSYTRFSGASLTDTNFSDARLEKADFRFSNIHGLEFWIKQFDDLSIDPRCKQLAVSSAYDIFLWGIRSRSLIKRVDDRGPWHVQHSPDGKYLVHSQWGGFTIRDSQTLELIYSLSNSEVPQSVKAKLDEEDRDNLWTTSFAFTSNSELLYVGCNNSAIYVWNLSNYQEVDTLLGHQSCIESVSLSPDETLLLSAAYKELITWDLRNKRSIAKRTWHQVNFGNALFHPKGDLAVVATEEGVLVLEPLSLNIVDSVPFDNKPRKVGFNQDGSLLGIGAWGAFALLDFESREEIFHLDLGSLSKDEYGLAGVVAFCFDDSNNNVFIACSDGFVAVVDLQTGQIEDLLRHLPDVTGANFQKAIGLNPSLAQQLQSVGAIV